MNGMSNINQAAAKADGRRRCDKCPLHPCTMTQFKVCTDGFRKGVTWKAKQLKSKDNEQRKD